MRKERLFLHKNVQYELSFRNENVLRMKIGSFMKSHDHVSQIGPKY